MPGLYQELKRRNVVRVAIAYLAASWLVLQVVDLILESTTAPDWIMQLILALTGLGFFIVVAFSWAFEITPEGVKRERDVDRTESITQQTGRRLDRIIIVVLVIALGYFVWERQALEPAVAPTATADVAGDTGAVPVELPEVVQTARRSIAVLPFVNMSSDTEQEWFADGLTEEVLNSLARTPDLLVAARTSSFGFKGSTDPVPQIAAALGVDHVLEGSVRRGGDTIRITAQLIRAIDGFHLWSETYDRTMEDIISIQEEIAVQIARALETAMDPEALKEMMSAGTNSVPAFEAYLTGVGMWNAAGATTDVYEALNARAQFERAIELDPTFAQAYMRLYWFWATETATNQMLAGLVDIPQEEKIARKNEALANAIRYQTDPITQIYYRANQARGQMEIRKALRLVTTYLEERPNDSDAFVSRINLLRELGLNEEIVAIIHGIIERDELTAVSANQSLQALRDTSEKELMLALARESVERFGDDDFSLLYQAHRLLLWAGDIDGASLILPRIKKSDLPIDNHHLAELRQLCAEQRSTDARSLFDKANQEFPDDLGLRWIGLRILGDDAAAEAMFLDYDTKKDFETLTSYLAYSHFDPKVFPNLMQAMAGQGMEERQVQALPYRCNR
jgi:TolB-like protein